MTAADPSAPDIDLTDVRVQFGALVALDDVGFSVPPGGKLGIVGPNGAGKTTLLNVLSGYVRPSEGTVRLFGQDAAGVSPEQLAYLGIGRSFQLADQFGRMTVLDFMLLGLMTQLRASFLSAAIRGPQVRREEKQAREQVMNELEVFGLGRLRPTERLVSLPYGIRKRLDIARASIGRPRILIADEPTSGLSSSECDEMLEVLELIDTRRNVTLVIVDHRVNFVTKCVSSLLVLDFGRVIGSGDCGEVLSRPNVREAYFGRQNSAHDS
jgi:branched-chain amino acid transport system ATP-binding protein